MQKSLCECRGIFVFVSDFSEETPQSAYGCQLVLSGPLCHLR